MDSEQRERERRQHLAHEVFYLQVKQAIKDLERRLQQFSKTANDSDDSTS